MEENAKGFEIALDTTRHLLRSRTWGFWDVELARKYQETLNERLSTIHKNGKDWYALLDLRDFYPRSASVQQILSQQIEHTEEKGIKKIGYLGKQSYVQLQLNRLFEQDELAQYGFFDSEDEAILWLLKG